MVGLSPQLAPMVAAMVVLGPGVKLIAVANTRNAVNSTAVIVVVMWAGYRSAKAAIVARPALSGHRCRDSTCSCQTQALL